MEDWKEYRLDELYVFGNGLSKGSKYFGYGHPFVSFKTVFNNYFLPEELSDYVDSDEKEQTKCSVQKSDVLLTRTSETVNELGYSCVALRDYPKATFNGFCKRMRPITEGIIHDLYAGYYFRSSHFRNQVCSMSNMVTRASLSNEMLGRLTIKLPSYKTQTQIGELLFSIDRKIALNRQINDNLEQQAQALYKSWFVDFEPFKDGEFIESEIGEIPAGWSIVKFGDIVEIPKKTINPQKFPDTIFNHYSLPACDNGLIAEVQAGKDIMSNKIILQSNTTLFSKLNPRIKRIWFTCEVLPNSICSTEFIQYRAKIDTEYSYIFSIVNSDAFYSSVMGCVNGATGSHQRFHAEDTEDFLCAYNKDAVNEFSKLIEPVLKQMHDLRQENVKLALTRDTLLPKLMSGELKINEIDC